MERFEILCLISLAGVTRGERRQVADRRNASVWIGVEKQSMGHGRKVEGGGGGGRG